jgi:hypothetical protein
MAALEKYSTIIRLQSSGEIKAIDRPSALQHLKTEHTEFASQDPLEDRTLQTLLVQELRQAHNPAALCLRCYASHYILISCQRLVNNYGDHYGLTISALAPRTLDDDGHLDIEITYHNNQLSIQRPAQYTDEKGDRYQPLSYRILEKFDPQKGSLSGWASRLTWQDSKLKKFLKEEYGILPISDWALLNDTQPQRLKGILIKHFNFSNPDKPPKNPGPNYQREVQQLLTFVKTLEAYHAIYRAEHTPQRGKPCPEPTLDQCQRMIAYLNLSENNPEDFPTKHLHPIADYIRRHRLKQLPPQAMVPTSGGSSIPSELLLLFDRYLKDAVAKTLTNHLSRQNPDKVRKILTILHLQYNEYLSQTSIAQELGLPGQYTISRLLNFKLLSIGIATHMAERLRNDTPKLAAYFNDADRLLTLQDQLQGYLEALVSEDERLRYNAAQSRQGQRSQLGEAICNFLEQYRPH